MQPTAIHSISTNLRRFILAFFVITFVVVTSAILATAHGYRYDTQHSKWVKTGIIVVKSQPKTVDVFVDGEQVDNRTPSRISRIFPGDHTIRVSKEGYHTWEKRLTAQAHQTTFATDITLFKNAEATALGPAASATTLFWLDQKPLAAQIKERRLVISSAKAPLNELWSVALPARSSRIAVYAHPHLPFAVLKLEGSKTRLATFDLYDDKKRMLVPSFTSSWDPDVLLDSFSAAHFYVQHRSAALKFDMNQKAYTTVGSGSLLQAQDEQLLWSKIEGGIPTLSWQTGSTSRVLAAMPLGFSPTTLSSSDSAVILWDSFTKSTSVFNTSKMTRATPIPITSSQAPVARFLDSGDWLLHSKHEIWLTDKQGNSELLERISTPLTSVLALPKIPYLLIQTNDEIFIRALDNRDGAQKIKLPVPHIKSMVVDEKGETLYAASADTLYSLELR